MTSAIGLGIITAGHRHGWPVAAGGSQSITNALASLLGELGGKIETGQRIESASQLPPSDVTIFDLAPGATAGILGDRLPGGWLGVSRIFGTVPARSRSISRSTAACRGPIRRRARPGLSTSAATTRKSRPRNAISMPAGCQSRPFVLVGQQYLADPDRSVGDTYPVWTYAHVPQGYTGDATQAILMQIERFAPGFRDRIVGQAVAPRPRWRYTTPTMSAGTSSREPRTSVSSCSDHAPL